MLGTFVVVTALAVVPQGTHARPPDCALEVLTPEALDQRALDEFDHRVHEYVKLHRRLARWLPPDQVFADEEDMAEASDMLADAIRAARPQARPGNLFAIAAGDVFRRIIARTEEGRAIVPEVMGPPYADLVERLKRPVVNGRPWWGSEITVSAPLLEALPALPHELTYRRVQSDLVIVDVLADLVVDVLENAFVEGGS